MWIFFFFFFLGGGGVITKSDFFFWGGGGGLFTLKIQNGIIFWTEKFQIFLAMPDIPDLFIFFWGGGDGGKQKLLGTSLCMRKD